MQKVILYAAIALCALLAVALAGPIYENEEVKQASKEALQRGLDFFGNGIRREQPERKDASNEEPKVFSQYTENIGTPSNGKPALVEQYRHHNYYPIPPSVVPPKFPRTLDGKYNAKQTAEIFKPRGPYQLSTDRLRLP